MSRRWQWRSSCHLAAVRNCFKMLDHRNLVAEVLDMRAGNDWGSKARKGKQLCAIQAVAVVFVSFTVCVSANGAAPGFQFEDVGSLEDMQNAIQMTFSIGSPREELRKVFVTEGNATLKPNPLHSNVEKYLYDINLCSYYVWRWNISADYDDQGKLQQAYVNGEPVFTNGTQKRTPTDLPAGTAKILKGTRLRPEASKGESRLSFLAYDAGSPSQTASQSNADRLATGAGPTRSDPANMGTIHGYAGVDLWRSIFDWENADTVHPYRGSCSAADAKYSKAKFALPAQT